MPLTLTVPPGYSDLSDSVLVAGSPALGIDIGKIYGNSVFGMVRPEVFVTGPYQNGDTVPLPVSPIDGYAYQRNELMYLWAVQNTVNKTSGWISAGDSLWYVAFLVDQATGQVSIDEWYRRSGSHYNGTHTNDGTLTVFTIAQRQQTNLVMASSPSYAGITSSWIGLDKPLTQQLAQGLNGDAKFSVVNHEAIYCGEFTNAATVPTPVSPADGYHYSYAECAFMFSWRWSPPGASPMAAPPLSDGQLGPMKASINPSTGVVSTTIEYDDNNGNLLSTNDGRIAVLAFCTRSGTPSGLTPAASSFTELSFDDFMPGSDLPFPTVEDILNNILEAIGTPEFFGPATHHNSDTIPLPTSPIDGYVYSRSELSYVWSFNDTTNAAGSNLRMASFGGDIDQTTGLVHLYGYRLPPGGPYTFEDQTQPTITVLTIARRQAHTQTTLASSTTTPGTGTTGSSAGSGADVPTVSSVLQDSFTGNGATTVYTTSQAPLSGFLMVFVGGQLMTGGGVDYTASGTSTITVTLNTAPASGEPVNLIYFQ